MNKKDTKDLLKKARKLAKPFRVTDDRFRLSDIDPGETLDFTSEDKPQAKAWPQASDSSPSSRRCSMPRTGGRSCPSSRPWTPPARIVRSST
jgi:hypothetical protein